MPTERPTLAAAAVDVEAAISNALANRTDVAQARKRFEASGITLDYARNQRLPDVNLIASYNTIGVAGTQFEFGGGFPPVELGRSERSFQDALRDVFGNDFKTWSLQLQLNYPIGTSQAEAQVAATRLQREQEQNTLRELEIGIAAQVREAGRRVSTRRQRVQSTRKRARRLPSDASKQRKSGAWPARDYLRGDPGTARLSSIPPAGAARDHRLQPRAVDFEDVQLALSAAGSLAPAAPIKLPTPNLQLPTCPMPTRGLGVGSWDWKVDPGFTPHSRRYEGEPHPDKLPVVKLTVHGHHLQRSDTFSTRSSLSPGRRDHRRGLRGARTGRWRPRVRGGRG